MGLPLTIRLNGKAYTRNSVSIRPHGLARFKDVDSISWSDERGQELVQPMNDGGIALGKATGVYSCEASISVYADACSAFEAMLIAGDPLSLGQLANVNFQLPIIMSEDSGARVRTIILVNCSIKGRSTSVGSDGTALVEEYKLQPTVILEDGQSLVNLIPAI